MNKKVLGSVIVGLLVITFAPEVNAFVTTHNENDNTTVYKSSLYGIGLVRLNANTHTLKGYVLFGMHDGKVITTTFINIEYIEEDMILAGYCTPFIFFFRYNPA